ncbi:MAG: DUF1015 domain-containing protein [Candidatus Aureabacteria bacterium]|nr:DUF1015 domain-containing protein [Candidatus Auribacterota bacterium]
MARIFPLRGYRYNRDTIKGISAVIAEPYDKITPELQEAYYTRDPHNIVRFSKGKITPQDDSSNNQYTRAREYLEKWIAEGVLVRDSSPALYVYNQEYSFAGGLAKVRHGFIALGELEEFGKGGVKPHERTLAGPKADRLNLMRATAAQSGLIFMLYSDPANEITAILAKASHGKPDMEARDDNGVIHRIWVVTDTALQQRVAALMEEKTLFIADGHHRYETALNYCREMREKGVRCLPGSESYDNHIMAFVSMQDSGLTILPTHRLLFGLSAPQMASFLSELAAFFTMTPCANLDEMLGRMKAAPAMAHCFGLYMNKAYTLLTLTSETAVAALMGKEASDDWKRLDVSIIHAILEKLLGIDRKKLEDEAHVAYERYADLAVKMIDEGRYQMAIFLNPTRAGQVAKIAGNGERMPQKSTDFYPKLYTGLVVNKLNLA